MSQYAVLFEITAHIIITADNEEDARDQAEQQITNLTFTDDLDDKEVHSFTIPDIVEL